MKIIKTWMAHCQTCKWNSKRSQEPNTPKQEKISHNATYPAHKVSIFVSE